MTSTADMLELVYGALTASDASTGAGPRVYRPGDWPTPPDQYPIIKLRVIGEQKQSLGRNAPQFTTTTTIRVIGEVSAPAQPDNAGAYEAENRLWTLAREIEVAIINSSPLFQRVQQLATMVSQMSFNAERTHLAGIQSDCAFEFYQGPEDFFPPELVDLLGVDVDATRYPPASITVDLPQE